jgi:uncharacterized protein
VGAQAQASQVKLVDLNLLIYAVDRDAPRHREARQWLERALSDDEPVGLAWVVVIGFLRLVTRAAVMRRPLDPAAAFDLVESWLDWPTVEVVRPGPQHWALLRSLLEPLGTAGNLTTDAHLAALALEHRATLCTADDDFRRFPGVRVHKPLG